jgi:hypothetical protein
MTYGMTNGKGLDVHSDDDVTAMIMKMRAGE